MSKKHQVNNKIDSYLKKILKTKLTPLDLLPRSELAEKLIELDLSGPPLGLEQSVAVHLADLAKAFLNVKTNEINVVILGGGTGLSNVVGGDSRSPGWPRSPFGGLKNIFPQTRAIVCVTDDGGSTGELLKDLPFIALGDLRHVLLSSVQEQILSKQYNIDEADARKAASVLYFLFNYRFEKRPSSEKALISALGQDLKSLPEAMRVVLQRLISLLFFDSRFDRLLDRPHCLGNLIVAVAIYLQIDSLHEGLSDKKRAVSSKDGRVSSDIIDSAVGKGLRFLARLMGAHPDAVLPCTTTPARLQFLYGNGIVVTGEYKSGHTRRSYPVEHVFVEFIEKPTVPSEVIASIQEADIIILAPGSLFSSTIPILQVPGIAEEIRNNQQALKILVSNLWVQKGETDVVRDDPKRRYYVSDLIKAYHRNIPGGVQNLFQCVLTIGFRDIPGSILQRYALEDKVPIYFDREKVQDLGFLPIEAGIFSHTALRERKVIQHDPDALARAIRTLWAIRPHLDCSPQMKSSLDLPQYLVMKELLISPDKQHPNQRYAAIENRLQQLIISPANQEKPIRTLLSDILWRHSDIHINHLNYFQGLYLIELDAWARSQQWDNVFSFYDLHDGSIKIRKDMLDDESRFEMAFLVALGESLLGDYAAEKQVVPIEQHNEVLGKVYRLTLRPPAERHSFLNESELDQYLRLSRMKPQKTNKLLYTRLVNGNEGFTPPGLLFGLIYAWYLDNSFDPHIEYKMAIMRNEISALIPEQAKMFSRRKSLIDFFRTSVFLHNSKIYDHNLSSGRPLP